MAWLLPGAAGCDLELSDLASFVDSDFADLTGEVTELNEAEVGAVMTELMRRFRSYLLLREAVPFAALAPEACITESQSVGGTFGFVADVACTFGAGAGAIGVVQEQIADNPVVIKLDVDYRDVVLGELEVAGTERIEETVADNGASIRRLDLTQNGEDFAYRFRLGLIDGETPIFDYEIPAPGGNVLARVTNPQTAGQFVTVFLSGLDGALSCEVRDAAWELGDAARGTCCDQTLLDENGSCDDRLTFGIPEPG